MTKKKVKLLNIDELLVAYKINAITIDEIKLFVTLKDQIPKK